MVARAFNHGPPQPSLLPRRMPSPVSGGKHDVSSVQIFFTYLAGPFPSLFLFFQLSPTPSFSHHNLPPSSPNSSHTNKLFSRLSASVTRVCILRYIRLQSLEQDIGRRPFLPRSSSISLLGSYSSLQSPCLSRSGFALHLFTGVINPEVLQGASPLSDNSQDLPR